MYWLCICCRPCIVRSCIEHPLYCSALCTNKGCRGHLFVPAGVWKPMFLGSWGEEYALEVAGAPKSGGGEQFLLHSWQGDGSHQTFKGRALSMTPMLSIHELRIWSFRGFDSSRILILRGGILMSIGNLPEISSQQILAGITLGGRCGVVCGLTASAINYSSINMSIDIVIDDNNDNNDNNIICYCYYYYYY